MEDDDEFGDLYTDVLRPFASSSSSAPQAQPSSAAPQSPSRPIDLNFDTHDDETINGATHPNSAVPQHSIDQTKVPSHRDAVQEFPPATAALNLNVRNEQRAGKEEESAEAGRFTRLGVVELTDRSLQDLNRGKESAIDDARNEVGVKPVDFLDKDVKFDIEEDGNGIEDVDSEPIIPGLSTDAGGGDGGGSVLVAATGAEASRKVDESGDRGEGDDWDSDSDDDLQIVLNDNNHMAMERGGMVDGDDDDEDEDGLVIVADGDPNQAAEEQDWGEDTTQPADGERKDTGESAKATGGMAVAPKVGYSNHGYHPFHSQFKYVRPGAAPLPGGTTTPGGPPSQIRPVTNMGPMAGRGRGDWRPSGIKGGPVMQKGFHSGPGMPGWGNSAAGRGFGGGLEFTLPSHKTIFDVDIDSFEEKPWTFPGIDASDFFNFGLNEEGWKDYCKQLEQLRLESTMQSKIRVYESGRAEQEYDPDLPPELAAAAGIHDVSVENTNFVKSDVGQSDLTKGSGRVRPPLPTGRAIQVEGGYAERLPSIDTRPPRIRDSDAIIEIVLQDSADDDSSAEIGGQDQSKGEPQIEDFRENLVVSGDNPREENDYYDGYEQDHNGQKRELVGRRMSYMNSSPGNVPEGDEDLPYPQEDNYLGSRGQTSGYSGGNFGSSFDERRMKGRAQDRSPHVAPGGQMAVVDNRKEESIGSMGDRHSAHLSSKDARESSVEDKDVELGEDGMVDGSSRNKKVEMDLDAVDNIDSLQDGELKGEKLTSQVEQPPLDEVDDWEDSKAARSSDNSKARSASSKDYQKRRDGFEEEVIQDARSARLGSIRRNVDDNEQGLRRREHEGRQELERNRMVPKGREKPYPYKERHPSSSHQLHTNTDGFERIKDRDNSNTAWARRDDDPYGRRVRDRDDESRKRDRGKVRDNERSDKGDSLNLRKQLDNGSYKVPRDKDVGSRDSRHRERDDGLKSRYEAMEDYNSKRRKDDEYLRREHAEKEEIPHGYRETNSRRRRERDEVMDPRKRDDLQRSRDSLEDHYAGRQKDEIWPQRERGDKQRDREEWHRVKQSHEEHLSKRDSKEGRGTVRGGRGTEEKAWVGHARVKDEQKVLDKECQSREQSKRRERIQDGSMHQKVRDDAYARGNQYNGDERRTRQERSSSRGDRVANASDNLKVQERKHKESTRKSKESDASDHDNLVLSKRNQGDQCGQINEKGLKDTGDEGRAEHDIPGHRLSRKNREDISSDDEQQDSHRGRSKLERWTSHKERDFGISSKTSSSLKLKDIDKDNNDGSSEAGKPLDESAKTVDAVDNQHPSSAEGKDLLDIESKDAESKLGDRHLDTVEKLKKRSERFKLPMPSEKEALAIKKMESEPLPSAKSENPVEPEIKQERPARKRRWISS